jgi:hypothetical protein
VPDEAFPQKPKHSSKRKYNITVTDSVYFPIHVHISRDVIRKDILGFGQQATCELFIITDHLPQFCVLCNYPAIWWKDIELHSPTSLKPVIRETVMSVSCLS